VALVTKSLHLDTLREGRLVQLFDIDASAGTDYYIAYAPRNARARKVKLFCDWALKEAAS
jgi:LysR family transcriptional regulator, glycine cleavage system transcriptional activator